MPMTPARTTWTDHAFIPAPAGWTVWECWAEGEAPSTYEAMPLAGWLTQAEHDIDEWGGLTEPTGERRIEPAVWRPEEGGLLSLAEHECSNSVVYLVGPGQEPPSHEAADDELQRKRHRLRDAS